MTIRNSSVNIMFERCENIKKQYILNNEPLKKNFNEANILPIPDEAPSEIPRIIITTKGEHSQLGIAPEAANFHTKYSGNYLEDWKLCESYINSRLTDVFKFLDTITMQNYKYMGIVANMIWDDIQKDGNKKLFQNLFGREPASNLDDLMVKYTYVEQEKYYVNITLQSVRIFGNTDDSSSGNFTDDNLTAHTVSILLDVNDRYSYNQQKGYYSAKQNFHGLIDLTTEIINNKLKKSIESGVY